MVSYQTNSDVYPLLRSKFLENIDIQLRDEEGALIDMNGTDWTATFVLNIYRKANWSSSVLTPVPIEFRPPEDPELELLTRDTTKKSPSSS
jgi:hypothetical protein